MGKVVPMHPGGDGRKRRSRTTNKSKVIPLPSAAPEREPLLGPVSSLIDEAFADAIARGLLDDLPGKGQPLPASFFQERDPYQPELTFDQQFLAEAGILPEWLKLRKQISTDLEWVRGNRPSGDARGARSGDPVHPDPTWEERVLQLNETIHKFNRICPPMMQIPLYRPEYED